MKLSLTLLGLAASLGASALVQNSESKDIVDTATAAGNFKTLTSLVAKAGLVDTLKGTGPFTVLAPTDAAFAKVPKATMAKLAANPDLLKKVLTYHVIAGSVMAADLKNGAKPTTVEGESLRVTVKGKTVMFNNAKVVMADVKASNGVIHAIDKVLLPPSGLK